MKSFTTAILALGAALVSAQTTMSSNMTTTLTTSSTSTYTDCTDVPDVTLTSTNTVTITYCSSCTMMSHGPKTDHTTVYTTVMTDICPTGASSGMPTPVTYTVTESCTGTTPTWSSGTDYVPQGFTTSVAVCNICSGSPTMTLTYPTNSPPAAFATTTTVPCPSCTGDDMDATPAATMPAPANAATTPAGAAAANTNYAAPSSTVAAPSAWGNTTGIMPYTPGANSASTPALSFGTAVLAVAAIAGAAFLL